MPKRTLVFDPAGDFGKDGNGTTGWALFEDGECTTFGCVEAKQFLSLEEYYEAVGSVMDAFDLDRIVCESYRLRGGKAAAAIGSYLETAQLIGYLRMKAYADCIKWTFQDPSIKARVTDEQLVHMGLMEHQNGRFYTINGRRTIIHMRDAYRHGVYFFKYGKEKVEK